MKKNLILLCLILLFTGCYEDKGNYDYTDIGDVKVDDILETYVIQRHDFLEIKPAVTAKNIDENACSYVWEVNGKEVSTKRDLSYKVIDECRDEWYKCRLKIVNNANSAEYYKLFNLRVVSPYYQGLVVLSENRDESASLSYFSIKENVVAEITKDVFELENGYKLKGKPLSLQENDYSQNFEGTLFVNTTKGGYDVDLNFMLNLNSFGSETMLNKEENFEIKGVSFKNYNGDDYGAAIGKNGKLYPFKGANKFFSLPSIDPCPAGDVTISDYDLSEYFIARTNTYGSVLGFLTYDNNEGMYIQFNVTSGTTDPDQMTRAVRKDVIGDKMFYMGVMDSNTNHTSLFHDGSYANWKLISTHAANYSTGKTPIYNLEGSSFKENSKIAVSLNLSILYYSSNGAIYTIQLLDPKKEFASTKLEIRGLGGEEITFLRFKNSDENELFVGTVKDEKGKIYEVNLNDNQVVRVFNIDGKPVDVYMKES